MSSQKDRGTNLVGINEDIQDWLSDRTTLYAAAHEAENTPKLRRLQRQNDKLISDLNKARERAYKAEVLLTSIMATLEKVWAQDEGFVRMLIATEDQRKLSLPEILAKNVRHDLKMSLALENLKSRTDLEILLHGIKAGVGLGSLPVGTKPTEEP
jgi:hypothetical protein